MSQDFRVALHEAGHAWASHVMGAVVTALSIVPDEDSDGHCSHTIVEKDRPWREHAVISLAGMAAVQVATGDTTLPTSNGTGGSKDMQKAAHLTGSRLAFTERACRITPSRRFLSAWGDAVELARDHFPSIHRLAIFLSRHQRMGQCCTPAIKHIEAGKDMQHWRYCAYCGIKLPESEAGA